MPIFPHEVLVARQRKLCDQMVNANNEARRTSGRHKWLGLSDSAGERFGSGSSAPDGPVH